MVGSPSSSPAPSAGMRGTAPGTDGGGAPACRRHTNRLRGGDLAPRPWRDAAVERAAGDLGAAAVQQMEATTTGTARCPPRSSWAGLVAQAGIRSFIDWFGQPGRHITADSSTPLPATSRAHLARADARPLRTVVDVVERESRPGPPRRGDALREAILRYSREVAFAAAEVYALAAEARGAWDARLEALVVDAVLRGEADDSMQSRAAALGWGSTTNVAVVVGDPRPGTAEVMDQLHRRAARLGIEVLAAIQGGRSASSARSTTPWAPRLSSSSSRTGPSSWDPRAAPVRRGPQRAGRDLRSRCRPRLAGRTPPGCADDLLAERALPATYRPAARSLDRVLRPLRQLRWQPPRHRDRLPRRRPGPRGDGPHPLRPRQHRALPDGVDRRDHGYDLTDPHDAQTVRLALARSCPGPRSAAVPPSPSRHCRNPTDRGAEIRLGHRQRGPRAGLWSRARHRLPRPGLPDPRLPRPLARHDRPGEPGRGLSDVAGIDLVTHGTTSDEETIKDTAVAQPLIVAAGLITHGLLGSADGGPSRRHRRRALGR